MKADQRTCARDSLTAAETDSLSFPEIVGRLMEAGFEGYAVDLRRASASYYLPSGESVALPTHADEVPVEAVFHTAALKVAIRDAQALVPGYSYKGFCRRVKAAGCAGYIVSFLGRRVLYYGRSAETHVEHFPSAQ